jgi:putative ABC transport system substrate-binding protein
VAAHGARTAARAGAAHRRADGASESDPQGQSEITAFRQGLQTLGWTGRNARIAYRWADGEVNRMRSFARGLIALQPDAVLAVTTPAVTALVDETRTVPIVFVRVSDPLGFVSSLAKPSGNVTGFSNFEPSLAGKWLQLLKEIAPAVARVTVMLNPATTPTADWISCVSPRLLRHSPGWR